VRIALPVVVSGLLTTQALAADLSVSVEIPKLNVAEYHRPYVALWIERSNQSVAANLAVWFDLKQKNNDGTKWLKDLRQWWRRSGRELAMPVDGLSGATRAAGEHQVTWSSDKLVPITHPNDLVQGEAASFRLLRDGKPAVDVAIAVVLGGIRYRDNLKEMAVSTDKDGKFTVTFPDAGMYWLSATVRTGGAPPAAAASHQGMGMASGASPAAGATPTQPPFRPGERAIYAATLEVMAK
jgi:hypothetical protein